MGAYIPVCHVTSCSVIQGILQIGSYHWTQSMWVDNALISCRCWSILGLIGNQQCILGHLPKRSSPLCIKLKVRNQLIRQVAYSVSCTDQILADRLLVCFAESYFRGQGITLNQRFANEQYYSLQDEFKEEDEEEEEEEEELGNVRPVMNRYTCQFSFFFYSLVNINFIFINIL